MLGYCDDSAKVIFFNIQCSLQKLPVRTWPGRPLFVPPSHFFCKAASLQDEDAAQVADTLSHYKDRPWDYLESEGMYRKINSLDSPYIWFYNIFLSSDRVHWEVWNHSSVGRLQEEPQRRHSPTEDAQDLHCKISNFVHFTLVPCIASVI